MPNKTRRPANRRSPKKKRKTNRDRGRRIFNACILRLLRQYACPCGHGVDACDRRGNRGRLDKIPRAVSGIVDNRTRNTEAGLCEGAIVTGSQAGASDKSGLPRKHLGSTTVWSTNTHGTTTLPPGADLRLQGYRSIRSTLEVGWRRPQREIPSRVYHG